MGTVEAVRDSKAVLRTIQMLSRERNEEQKAWKMGRSGGTGLNDKVNRIHRKNEEMGDLTLWSGNIIVELRITGMGSLG